MLAARLHARSVFGFSTLTATDQANGACRLISDSRPFSLSIQLDFAGRTMRCRSRPKPVLLVTCKASRGSSYDGDRSANGRGRDHGENDDQDYLQASLLVSETLAHYCMRKPGFQEELRWLTSGQLLPFSHRRKESWPDLRLVGHEFLRRFQSPTMFLKVSCDGEFLLPIVVGDFAIEMVVDAIVGDDGRACPDQFHLTRNLIEKLGYEVKMVKITERVISTYFSQLYFGKPGEDDILSVDARPSDAINVAIRCKAPIYVSKQIVFSDAIRISYAVERMREMKCTYDVSLDSAIDGPDLLVEELALVRNMNLAIKEERYKDAAICRDKLMELRNSSRED